MDELVRHCIREIAFDGDLGSNATRLRVFVTIFYQNQPGQSQNLDDAFHAFVWSLVVQQPSVRVGRLPAGLAAEVYIAPQPSAVKKGKGKVEVAEGNNPRLELITDAGTRGLDDLVSEFGDALRIAVDPEQTFAAITGSHIRPQKMTPMVYTALQLITRGREEGITVVELGQRSKYDQKTCFYLVKQLIELNLIAKVRCGGVGSNLCVHRHFYDNSPRWKEVRDEESKAQELFANPPDAENEDDGQALEDFGFTPIDARHLSSLPLIKARVVKLLKASHNHIHVSNNMLLRIGFAHPTKTDRRFFNSRIRELVQLGLIEAILVPSRRKGSEGKMIKCFRLVASASAPAPDEAVPAQLDDDDEEIEAESERRGGLRTNITLHKQIVDLLEDSGTSGMTMNELSAKLGDFDKRTIDLLLTRAEKQTPPSHLSDLGISIIMENYGRERRNRYFTIASYRQLLENEHLDAAAAGYGDIDLSEAGGFASVSADIFYEDADALLEYHDAFLELSGGLESQKKKEKKRAKAKAGRASAPVKGRKSKLADDLVAIEVDTNPNEPRNQGTDTVGSPRGRKRKHEGDDDHSPPATLHPLGSGLLDRGGSLHVDVHTAPEAPTTTAQPKKRGRPSKSKSVVASGINETETTISEPTRAIEIQQPIPPPRKRGRLAKSLRGIHVGVDDNGEITAVSPISRKRGRRPSDPDEAALEELPLSKKRSANSHGNTSPEALPRRPHTRATKTLAMAKQQSAPSVEGLDVSTSTPAPASPPGERQPVSSADASQALLNLSRSETPPPTSPQRLPSCGSEAPIDHNKIADLTPVPSQPEYSLIGSNSLAKKAKGSATALPQSTQSRTAKANVSHMRRGNEFYQLIVNLGGIINVNSKEFADAHLALIDSLAQAGEPTSAPVGARVDKRTVNTTLETMESKGRIKLVKTQIMTRTGVPRPTTVVHLPDIDQAKLVEFLSSLSDTAPIPSASNIRRIEEPVEYGSVRMSERRSALPLQLLRDKEPGDAQERWSRNDHRADQLWQYDEATIRDVLLTERTTAAQYYGYIVGRAARLRKTHLLTLSAFQNRDPYPHIVSHQERIVHLGFYNQDLPLNVYLSLCAALSYNDALSQFYRNGEDAETPVQSLPSVLHTLLQVNRSRARTRFLDIMQSLMYLQLATPLRPTDSTVPDVQCVANGEHPTSFDVASPEGWTPSTPNAAPTYWKFNLVAPVFTWTATDTPPILLQKSPVSTYAQAVDFWTELKDACLRKRDEVGALGSDDACTSALNDSLTSCLRRVSSWNDQYFLTWHQKQYLTRALSNESVDVDASKLAWIVSAPKDIVERFIVETRGQFDKVVTKVRRRRDRLKAEKAINEANKALIADMAAEARAHRESEWDAMVARVHPEPLKGSAEVRLRPVRKLFLQAVSIKGLGKWEEEIQQTLREAALAASTLLAKRQGKSDSGQTLSRLSSSEITFLSPPVVHNPVAKSVAELIAQQGPAIPEEKRAAPKKRKRGKKAQEEEPLAGTTGRRRHRFSWDNDYEELARDAAAIIKARCRGLPRLELAALDQVFPSVPRNTVRQRLVHIRNGPGNEAYSKRLEDKWYELWIQHRGTDLLPDDDPQSASNFDLPKHIEFLRKHIDKNALRVGFTHETTSIAIPDSIDDLLEIFEVIEPPTAATSWDFVWKGDAEEGREKSLAQQPFCKSYVLPCIPQENGSEEAPMAEAVLKMVFGTPNELYDPEVAAHLLRSIGEEAVSVATKTLLGRGVLSKHLRDPNKEKPGRRLKIADVNQNALGGSLAFDTFQDAVALDDDICSQQDPMWRTWPLLGTDGDLASLLQQVSDNKVDLRVDTSAARAARTEVEWNSKKADDDQIETSIEVRFLGLEPEGPKASPHPVALDTQDSQDHEFDEPGHGMTRTGDAASCRKATPSMALSDCQLCLAKDTDSFMSTLSQADASAAQLVLSELDEAREKGVSISDLWGRVDGLPFQYLWELVHQMTDGPSPLAFLAGYTKSVVVSSHHLKAWSVLVSDDPVRRVLPRRWLDISGSKITEVWDAALRAVISVIHFRPGITQAEIGWRLRGVYDRQEINDILLSLRADGFVRIIHVDLDLAGEMLDVDEAVERSMYCFINHEKHWYMV